MTAKFPTLPKSRREKIQAEIDSKARELTVEEQCEIRAQRLMETFNGAIKYLPMLMDHGDHKPELEQWTDEECIEFAKEMHALAIIGLTNADELSNFEGWNHGIPYCRNIPTKEMLEEAGYDS